MRAIPPGVKEPHFFLGSLNDRKFSSFRIECKLVRARDHYDFFDFFRFPQWRRLAVIKHFDHNKRIQISWRCCGSEQQHRAKAQAKALRCLIKRNQIESRVGDRSCSTFWSQPTYCFLFSPISLGFFESKRISCSFRAAHSSRPLAKVVVKVMPIVLFAPTINITFPKSSGRRALKRYIFIDLASSY